MQHLTSRRHPLVSRFREIARGGEEESVLLDGAHLVGEAMSAGVRIHDVIVRADAIDRAAVRPMIDAFTRQDIHVTTASAAVMDAVSPVQSASEIVAVAERPSSGIERMYTGAVPLVIVAADVQNPGNLGAIIRVAEAGGATGVMVTGESAHPFGWKALRGSMASALRLPVAIERSTDRAVAEARRRGCTLIATLPRGGDAHVRLDLRGPLAILIGGEGGGIPPALIEAADLRVTIPMAAPVESLNVALATAILVYEAYRQRHGLT